MLLLLLQQQCCVFLLLFVIVCQMAKVVPGLLNLIPAFSFSSFNRDPFFMVPLGSICCVAFAASNCLQILR